MLRNPPCFSVIRRELLLATAIHAVYFLLVALVLWPFGLSAVAGTLALAWCLYLVTGAVVMALDVVLHSLFRIEVDPPSTTCLCLNLLLGGILQLGWAAFVALTITGNTPEAGGLAVVPLYLVGLLASWFSTVVTGAYFQGSVYRQFNSLLALAGYVVFAIWPAVASAMYGWFFVWF